MSLSTALRLSARFVSVDFFVGMVVDLSFLQRFSSFASLMIEVLELIGNVKISRRKVSPDRLFYQSCFNAIGDAIGIADVADSG